MNRKEPRTNMSLGTEEIIQLANTAILNTKGSAKKIAYIRK
jgi:hypothetical protein